MHHYKHITIHLIVFSPALLKTYSKKNWHFTCTGKKKPNQSTTDNFAVRSLTRGKIAKGHYRIFIFFQ